MGDDEVVEMRVFKCARSLWPVAAKDQVASLWAMAVRTGAAEGCQHGRPSHRQQAGCSIARPQQLKLSAFWGFGSVHRRPCCCVLV